MKQPSSFARLSRMVVLSLMIQAISAAGWALEHGSVAGAQDLYCFGAVAVVKVLCYSRLIHLPACVTLPIPFLPCGCPVADALSACSKHIPNIPNPGTSQP